MADSNAAGSPLEAAAEVAGDRTTEAFTLLANETRLAILLALWEAGELREIGWAPVPFSELRERVGMPDSGQFNYHLGELEGEFVERIDDGYKLNPTGDNVVMAIIGAIGFEEAAFPATEIDLECPICGAPTAIAYQDTRLYHLCTECDGNYDLDDYPAGMLANWESISDAALKDRTARAIHSAASLKGYHSYALAAAGVCQNCGGQIDNSLELCENHDPAPGGLCPECDRGDEVASLGVCGVCKFKLLGPVANAALHHPAVIAFYWEHGLELGHDPHDTGRLSTNKRRNTDEELLSRNPPRVRVTFNHQGDEIELIYDEEMNVIEVNEDY